MARSINNQDTDWKREWEDESTLTPEEQKEHDKLKAIEEAQTKQILEDLRMMELEAEQEEERRKNNLRAAREYLKDAGWSDVAISVLSDDELLEAAEVEAAYEEEVYDFYEPEEDL